MHRAGEKLFVDYAGQTVTVLDPASASHGAQIFVAVLGASNYTFACATWRQTQANWIAAQIQALEYFGGVPQLIVPAQPRALISQPSRYEPEPHGVYEEFAAHYGAAVLPARPHKPKDKAKVEGAVLVVERWILARLRHRQFFSLVELNGAIRELVEALNHRPFQKLPGTRASAFAALDQPRLKPLPFARFVIAHWRVVSVNIDYHVEVEGHFYSLPHRLVGEQLEVRLTATTVECFLRNARVASHARAARPGAPSTVAEHMPKAHRAHREWTPGRLLDWALGIGTATHALLRYQLEHKPHPEMGYRACLGLRRLAEQYGAARLEAACQRALAIGAPTYCSVASILKTGLDQRPPLILPTEPPPLPAHENVRGAHYYHGEPSCLPITP